MNKAAMSIHTQICVDMFSLLLGKYLRVECLAYETTLSVQFYKKLPKIFQSGCITIYFDSQYMKVPVFLYLCLLLLPSVFNFSHCKGWIMIFNYNFDLYSFMTNDVRYPSCIYRTFVNIFLRKISVSNFPFLKLGCLSYCWVIKVLLYSGYKSDIRNMCGTGKAV